jgi:hypothetical protein
VQVSALSVETAGLKDGFQVQRFVWVNPIRFAAIEKLHASATATKLRIH